MGSIGVTGCMESHNRSESLVAQQAGREVRGAHGSPDVWSDVVYGRCEDLPTLQRCIALGLLGGASQPHLPGCGPPEYLRVFPSSGIPNSPNVHGNTPHRGKNDFFCGRAENSHHNVTL